MYIKPINVAGKRNKSKDVMLFMRGKKIIFDNKSAFKKLNVNKLNSFEVITDSIWIGKDIIIAINKHPSQIATILDPRLRDCSNASFKSTCRLFAAIGKIRDNLQNNDRQDMIVIEKAMIFKVCLIATFTLEKILSIRNMRRIPDKIIIILIMKIIAWHKRIFNSFLPI